MHRRARSFTLILFLLLPGIQSCFTHWTEDERQAFAQQCALKDTIADLTFSMTGFDNGEIDSICVRQVHEGRVVDSFYVQPHRNSFDFQRKRFTASVDRPLYRKDTYEFSVSGYPPFILSDMQLVIWDEYTMFSEGHGCVMGDYKIDGVRFEHNTNPDFVRKGYQFH